MPKRSNSCLGSRLGCRSITLVIMSLGIPAMGIRVRFAVRLNVRVGLCCQTSVSGSPQIRPEVLYLNHGASTSQPRWSDAKPPHSLVLKGNLRRADLNWPRR